MVKPKPQYFPTTLSVLSSISMHSSKLPRSITLPLKIPDGIFEEASNTETKIDCYLAPLNLRFTSITVLFINICILLIMLP